MIVLSVQVHQAVADFCQGGNRDRAVIKQAAVFPGIGNLAFDKKFAFFHFDAGFSNQVESFGVCNFKYSVHKSGGFSRTNGVGICSTSKQEIQRIDDDGFTRAGFTRQHIQAFFKVHRQIFYDGEIANSNFFNHGSWKSGASFFISSWPFVLNFKRSSSSATLSVRRSNVRSDFRAELKLFCA